MSSGLRHVLKTRDFRERSQPAARAKFGLLEKHKDYVLRARDFHRKQDAINSMRNKAAFKNPDEFYFGMVHTKMVGGVHQKKVDNSVSGDELKKFKKDDATYVAMKHQMESRKVEKLRANLHGISKLEGAPQNKRIIFVDPPPKKQRSAVARPSSSQADGSNEPLEDVDMGVMQSLRTPAVTPASRAASKKADKVSAKAEKKLAARYSELKQREQRQAKLAQVMQRISQERALIGKGRRKKLRTKQGQPRVFKWRPERKR